MSKKANTPVLIDSREALQILGLLPEGSNPYDRLRYLNWLNKRGLLKRWKITGKGFKYDKAQVEGLLLKSMSDGIILTLNPNQKTAA